MDASSPSAAGAPPPTDRVDPVQQSHPSAQQPNHVDVSVSFDAAQDGLLDAEITQPATAAASSQLPTSSSSHQSATQQPAVLLPTVPDDVAHIQSQKDAHLRAFLSQLDNNYTPLIPDAVTDYYLTLAGLPPPSSTGNSGTDRRLARLIALATQKFVADVAADAYQYARIRSTNTTSNNPLTGLGGAAGFGVGGSGASVPANPANPSGAGAGDGDVGTGPGKGKRETAKNAPLGGPRPGYGGGGGAAQSQGRTVLTMEDLGMAVGEYGVNVRRGEFYR